MKFVESVMKEFLGLKEELSDSLPIKKVEPFYRFDKDLEEAAKQETLCDIVMIDDHAVLQNYSTVVTVSNPKVVPYTLSPRLLLAGAAFGLQSGMITVDLSEFPLKKSSIIKITEPYKDIATKIFEKRGYILK